MTKDFFYLAYWQQQLLTFFLVLFLFLFGYLYFVHDLQISVQQKKETYQNSIKKIELLEHQFAKYANKSILSVNLISEHKLAQLLHNHNLTLQKFSYHETHDANRWEIVLQGSYADFVDLLNTLIENYYSLELQDVSISKKENKQLGFVVKLGMEKRKS